MTAVYLRELKSYFTGLTGYIFIALTLVTVGLYALMMNFTMGYANFEYALSSASFIHLLLVPVLTMRSFSEERKNKTDMLIYSLPLRIGGVVAGKYLAMVTILAIPMVIMCVYPLVLSLYGPVRFAPAYGSIFAFFLLGCALTAIGMFISSTTENQIVSAAISFIAVLITYLMGDLAAFLSTSASTSLFAFLFLAAAVCAVIYILMKNGSLALLIFLLCAVPLVLTRLIRPTALEGAFQGFMSMLSLFDRFGYFVSGIFDLTAVVYYISLSLLFFVLTRQSMDKRRWG